MPTLLPPPQYDHTPSIPVVEHMLPFDELSNICDQITSGAFGACSRVTRDAAGKITRCEIWLAQTGAFVLHKERRWFFSDIGEWRTYPMGTRGTVSVEFPEEARRHEHGHCNGWSAEHPTAELPRVAPLPRARPDAVNAPAQTQTAPRDAIAEGMTRR